jgi:hypothetical protein
MELKNDGAGRPRPRLAVRIGRGAACSSAATAGHASTPRPWPRIPASAERRVGCLCLSWTTTVQQTLRPKERLQAPADGFPDGRRRLLEVGHEAVPTRKRVAVAGGARRSAAALVAESEEGPNSKNRNSKFTVYSLIWIVTINRDPIRGCICKFAIRYLQIQPWSGSDPIFYI